MRIESAFIADHAEVNPATRTLDVRSGFQSSIRVPKLPFRHVLALALVIQVASDDYGRAFTLGIDVDRVDELPVMRAGSATTTRSPSPCRSTSTTLDSTR
jgi:hypothetical protein